MTYSPNLGRWLQEDPLAYVDTNNLYEFVSDNPVNQFDPLGFWTTEAHNDLIDSAFPAQWQIARRLFKEESENVDSILRGGQNAANSYQHGMRAPNETPAQAKAKTQLWIDTLKKSAARKYCRKDYEGAMRDLGKALHAIMDSNSPVHRDINGNPLPWKGVEGMAASVALSGNGAVQAAKEGWDTRSHTSAETLEKLNADPVRKRQTIAAMRDYYLSFLREVRDSTSCDKGFREWACGVLDNVTSYFPSPAPERQIDPRQPLKNTDEIRQFLQQINGRPT